jgi:hypothetical protein
MASICLHTIFSVFAVCCYIIFEQNVPLSILAGNVYECYFAFAFCVLLKWPMDDRCEAPTAHTVQTIRLFSSIPCISQYAVIHASIHFHVESCSSLSIDHDFKPMHFSLDLNTFICTHDSNNSIV